MNSSLQRPANEANPVAVADADGWLLLQYQYLFLVSAASSHKTENKLIDRFRFDDHERLI